MDKPLPAQVDGVIYSLIYLPSLPAFCKLHKLPWTRSHCDNIVYHQNSDHEKKRERRYFCWKVSVEACMTTNIAYTEKWALLEQPTTLSLSGGIFVDRYLAKSATIQMISIDKELNKSWHNTSKELCSSTAEYDPWYNLTTTLKDKVQDASIPNNIKWVVNISSLYLKLE